MNVVLDGRSLASPAMRGWDRYTVGLVRALVARGIAVTLAHRERSPLCLPHVEGIDCRTVALADRGGLSWEQVSLPRYLAQAKADVYHAPAEHGVPLVSPCPVTLTVHSVTTASYRSLIASGVLAGRISDYLDVPNAGAVRSMKDVYYRFQLRRPEHIFTPSRFCRDEVIEHLGAAPERVTATPLAVGSEFTAPMTDGATRAATLARHGVVAPYLLYVGGFERHKNVAGLLDVFAEVKRVRADLSLVIVGSGAVPDDLRACASRRGLRVDRDVRFLSNVTADLVALYDAAELFVSLSWRESFGLPALEAMSRGVSVIVSGLGAAREVVGDVGTLVNPSRPDEIVRAIVGALAMSPSAREQQRSRAVRRSREFSWSATADRTIAVYEALVRRELVAAS
ncbi:MAG TPA: glycosyltransferase family 1 protein [Gemmatimonadaceae bacterium]|nr:glycosyltransferase family 1 protein [Gemmatimonadaceae bacterium]